MINTISVTASTYYKVQKVKSKKKRKWRCERRHLEIVSQVYNKFPQFLGVTQIKNYRLIFIIELWYKDNSHHHHHHHHQPLSPLQASPNLLNSSFISCLCVSGYSNKTYISSLHLVHSLPCLLLPFLNCHFVTPTVHLLSLGFITCPAYVHYFLLIVVKLSSTLVCSLIHDALFLSLCVTLNIFISIPLWAV